MSSHKSSFLPLCLSVLCVLLPLCSRAEERPNILVAISDDQSFPHVSIAGARFVSTPAFDRVAREGAWFKQAIAASPGCSPSRASLLTGRHTWQNRHAGTHASLFPADLSVYPEALAANGYHVGFTGKGWGPGDWKTSGRRQNPAGPEINDARLSPPVPGISAIDYAANFAAFLRQRKSDQPFCFWFGGQEPHRRYTPGSGLAAGKRLEDVDVPAFLPDTPDVRSDLLDYALEIEWFDGQLGAMLRLLEETGELDNTLIIVTADNGMPFPRAKANTYEYGIHVPLAMRWGRTIRPGHVVDDVVGFVDLTATILAASGVDARAFSLSGENLLPRLTVPTQNSSDRSRVAYAARERHSSARYRNETYPQRALRTDRYLLIHNIRPDRWPAGDPQTVDGKPYQAFHDIDASPSLTYLINHREDPKVAQFFRWAVDKRPEWELFDIQNDPACVKNLAEDPAFTALRTDLTAKLEDELRRTGDPRSIGDGEIWETYPRNSAIREFPPPPDRL